MNKENKTTNELISSVAPSEGAQTNSQAQEKKEWQKHLSQLSKELEKDSYINLYYDEVDDSILEAIFEREFKKHQWNKFNWSHEIEDSELTAVFEDPDETRQFMLHLIKQLFIYTMDYRLIVSYPLEKEIKRELTQKEITESLNKFHITPEIIRERDFYRKTHNDIFSKA